MLRNEFIYIQGLGFYSTPDDNEETLNENLDSINFHIKELSKSVTEDKVCEKIPVCTLIELQIANLKKYINGFDDERVRPIWMDDETVTKNCLKASVQLLAEYEQRYQDLLVIIHQNAKNVQSK